MTNANRILVAAIAGLGLGSLAPMRNPEELLVRPTIGDGMWRPPGRTKRNRTPGRHNPPGSKLWRKACERKL